MLGVVRGGACAAFAALMLSSTSVAEAAPACPPRPIRWMEDCSALAGRDLTGLDRLRYIPVGESAWLTLGGEARVRYENLDALDFSIAGGQAFNALGRRAMAHADFHFSPRFRVFGQVASAWQDGRAASRAQDRDMLDVSQLFVDLPLDAGPVNVLVRAGQQELDLSENRLITTRDGVNMRRSFRGVKTDFGLGQTKLSVFHLRPGVLSEGVLDDSFDRNETFDGANLDLPRINGGLPTIFVFDRTRDDGRSLDASGKERRYTAGARYDVATRHWDSYVQVARQWGKTAAGPRIDALGVHAGTAYQFGGTRRSRVVLTFAYASGDRARGDGETNTFDPLYPNNFGLSDAPFLYQTNYTMLAPQVFGTFGGTEFGVGAFYAQRASTGDAIYAQGRPLAGTLGGDKTTAWLAQVSARRPLTQRIDFYGSIVHALVGDIVTAAGGRDSTAVRLDVNARF